jgi:DNA-binding SARP family transcriptional activator
VAPAERPRLWIESFGGLKISRDGAEIALGSVRPLAILAILLAARGDTVSLDRLVSLFWRDDPPQSAVNQIHRHVGELRRLLEPDVVVRGEGSFIERRAAGYRLQLGASESQIERFFSLAAAAGDSAESGDIARALEKYADALHSGSLTPFLDLPSEFVSTGEFESLDSARLQVAINAADLALKSGNVHLIVEPFLRVAASAPFNEVVQARAIELLAADGRGAEAAQHYEAVRVRLDSELGVRPGKELKAALSRIAGSPAAPEVRAPLSTLPPDVGYFLERELLRGPLTDLAQDARNGRGVVALLTGMGGIGKTALAVHWARSLAADFPDGQLYLNLLGFDPALSALTAEQAVDQLLAALKLQTPASYSPEDRAAFLRVHLHNQRILLLLDNARDSDQVRPLIPGAPQGLVIVTSRDNLVGLAIKDGARRVPVNRWSFDESRELWNLRLGTSGGLSGEAVTSVIDFCAGLPLALSILASQASIFGGAPAETLSKEIIRATKPLDAFATDSQGDDLRSTFAWSYRSLSDDARRLFRLLSVHPGPTMSLRSIASVSDVSLERARHTTGELVTANLLLRASASNFVFHDLIRAFAGEVISVEEQSTACTRLFDHYLRGLRNAASSFGHQYDFPLPVEGEASVGEETFATSDAALEWYKFEYTIVDALFERALELGLDSVAVAIELERRPTHEHLFGVSLAQAVEGLAAARRTEDPTFIAEMLRSLFLVSMYVRPNDDAGWTYATDAVALFEAAGNDVGLADTYRNMSTIALRPPRSRADEAVSFAQLSVESAQRLEPGRAQASARLNQTIILVDAGQFEQAIDLGEQMLDYLREWMPQFIPDLYGMFGKAHFGLGAFSRSLEYALESLSRKETLDTYDLEVVLIAAESAAYLGDGGRALSLVSSFRSIVELRPELAQEMYGAAFLTFVERIHAAERRAGALPAAPSL